MILVLGHLQLRPGGASRLYNALVAHTTTVRALDGCDHYALASSIEDPDRLCISERWRDRAAQSAHLVGDHMPRFNVSMRIATVTGGTLDAYEGGKVRKMLEVPAQRFRAEYEDRDMIVVMGTARFEKGELARLKPAIEAQLTATRAEDGCDLYAYSIDVLDPDLMHISERWRDHAALTAHFASPHMAAFNEVLATARIESLNVKAYDAEGERVLMSR